MNCRICDNENDNKTYKIKEMMYGFNEEFDYLECSKCGCLQIVDFPESIGKYYPSNYYSFNKGKVNHFKKHFVIKRNEYVLFKKNLIGKMVNRFYNWPLLETLSLANLDDDSKILDVGCGAGHLLYSLKEIGFKDLTGVDPFVSKDSVGDQVKIYKKTIHELPDSQQFDIIIFNHSFEHIADEFETISKASRLLSSNGSCIIGIPIKTEYIWDRYNINWVQVDAPRHYYLHTLKSFEHLASRAGLIIRDVIFDSSAFQFWGSEQYKKNINLTADNSYFIDHKNSIFSAVDIKEFNKKAEELNKNKQGDQALFYLVKT